MKSAEHAYALSADYVVLFEDVLAYCRESVAVGGGWHRTATRPLLGGDRHPSLPSLQPRRRRRDAGEACREDRR